jgi:GT2 family glycosyltransferase
MTPFISVIVPVRNGGSTLADCLASLLRSDFPAEQREIRWLAELLSPFAEDGAAAAAGRTLAFPPRTATQRYVAQRRASSSEWAAHQAVPYFQFANAAVRRDVFERVGAFDPRFQGAAEDIDLAWRFFQAGYELSRVPQAIVLHRHRTSARELFCQHVGFGHGQASLLRKYPHLISWGWRREARAWADLAAGVCDLAAALARKRGVPRSSPEVQYPYLDLVRKLGQRLGFLRGWSVARRGGADEA